MPKGRQANAHMESINMHTSCFVFLVLCVAFAASLDLGPYIRIAQCRSQCIKANNVDGDCEWELNRNKTTCNH
ncbi:hypothetical protein PV325_010400, partial [Microctonus aethiopoides]